MSAVDRMMIEEKRRQREERDRAVMRKAAVKYAQADRTDPFALMRAETHIQNGVASIKRSRNQEYGIDDDVSAFYSATAVPGKDGKVQYIDVTRP